MNYSLLELDDYEKTPAEPHRKFAVLEQAARQRMNEIMDNTQSGDLATELRTQYTTLMIAMASALGIPGVTYPEGEFRHEWEEHQAFSLKVQGVVAKDHAQPTNNCRCTLGSIGNCDEGENRRSAFHFARAY